MGIEALEGTSPSGTSCMVSGVGQWEIGMSTVTGTACREDTKGEWCCNCR